MTCDETKLMGEENSPSFKFDDSAVADKTLNDLSQVLNDLTVMDISP